MKNIKANYFKFLSLFILLLLYFGCNNNSENINHNLTAQNNNILPTATKSPLPTYLKTPFDISKFADKSIAEIEREFGKPEESKKQYNGGEYRLYKISNQSKGLAVRFYGGKAKSFNIITEKSFATGQELLKQTFGIDVGKTNPIKEAKEPLSEKWKGNFGGVRYSKILAKKQEDGKGFIFVLAEIE